MRKPAIGEWIWPPPHTWFGRAYQRLLVIVHLIDPPEVEQ